jgi:hypothetical protein
MSLPVSEARVLTRIEEGLLSRDPRLRSIFSIFTRLTWQEAMPAREQIRRQRWRPRPGAMILVAMVLAVAGIVAASLTMPARACSSAQHEVMAGPVGVTCAPARHEFPAAAAATRQRG